MRFISITLLLFVFSFLAPGQLRSQSVFNKVYSTGALICQTVVCDSSGGIYVGGTLPGEMFVMKLDSNGSVIWSKKFGEYYRREILRDMIVIPGNRLVIAGTSDGGTFSPYQQSIIIILDSSGAQISTSYIGDTLSPNEAMSLFLEENDFLLVSNGFILSDDYTVVTKFDLNGNKISENSFFWTCNVIQLRKANNYYFSTNFYTGYVVTDSAFSNPVYVASDVQECIGMTSLIINEDSNFIGVGPEYSFIELFDSTDHAIYYNLVYCSIKVRNIFNDGNRGYYLLGSGTRTGVIHLDENFHVINSVVSNWYPEEPAWGIRVRGTISPWGKIIFVMLVKEFHGINGLINVISVDSTLSLPCGEPDSITIHGEYDWSSIMPVIMDTVINPFSVGVISMSSIIINDMDCADTTLYVPDAIENSVKLKNYDGYYLVEAEQLIDEIEIIGINGNLIREIQVGSHSMKIETESLRGRIYFLRVICKNRMYYFKILKS